ncbi:hypothetical protein H2199_008291 [Coniosporium tulheliwenetii]|uniref:Uncharacterized protein n=1 Tax=Coniosporium tulheliwenetii TaxID=3383036 RepID=A0ACC2YKZ3_9PEZI|nr:hypothetical protein H2199_008291 [Cladosporium sp. JES 115]
MALPNHPSPSDNRFALVTPDDYQGYVYIVTITSLVWSSIVFIVRLFIKWGCYSGDDVLAGLAQVVGFGQWLAVFIALGNGLGKNISSPDEIEQFTIAKVLRWKVITAFDVLIESALVILPAYLVSRVRIQLGKKLVVVVAFAFRLPAAGFFIAHLTAYSDSAHHRNTGTKFSTPIIWQQVVIAYSLAAVTIPTLKPFLQGFNTGGMGYTSEAIIGSSAAANSMGSGQRSGWGANS